MFIRYPTFICLFFWYESSTEGTNFRIMFVIIIMFHVCISTCMFYSVFNLCEIETCEKAEGTNFRIMIVIMFHVCIYINVHVLYCIQPV